MAELGSFWAGALTRANKRDLWAMRDAAGGWQRLMDGGVSALVHAGIAPSDAHDWLSTPPIVSEGRVIRMCDGAYPAGLRDLPGAPPVLFVEGDTDCFGAPAIGIVGTRECNAYGRGVAAHLAGALAAAGVVVVSGLARGIDTEAHRAAVRSGRTIAVLGHGLGTTAPPVNRGLRRDIVEHGGLVLSSWPDAMRPTRYTFPARNRWIAALSQAVVVVQAPRKSGALITARQAAELGREVFAVPGDIGNPHSAGCNWLLQSGAHPLIDVDAFVGDVTGRASPVSELWVAALFSGGSLDEVAKLAGRSTVELLAELSLMELRGEVVRLPGGRYARAGSPA